MMAAPANAMYASIARLPGSALITCLRKSRLCQVGRREHPSVGDDNYVGDCTPLV